MSDDPQIPVHLTPEDAEALDALFEANFDPDAVPSFHKARARRLAMILGLLDGPTDASLADHRGALVDVTLARAARAHARYARSHGQLPTSGVVVESRLSDADTQTLDALVDAGWSFDKLDGVDTQRAEALRRLFGALDAADSIVFSDVERRSLVERTMRTIRRGSLSVRSMATGAGLESVGRGGGFRMWDVVSMAAMILIGFFVIWPMAEASRERSNRLACQVNLQNAGFGISSYAADHKGMLPHVRDEQTRRTPTMRVWWKVGDPEGSHSANLFVLVRYGYLRLSDLACAGNPSSPTNLDLGRHRDWRNPDEVSYSYQLFGPRVPTLRGAGRLIVLTDRSPVIQRARRGERFDPEASSLNHKGHGQWALHTDGAVEWLETPVLANGDNIWLPHSKTGVEHAHLTGDERPDHEHDVFVGP